MYNANRELKDYTPKQKVYVTEARRKTPLENVKKYDTTGEEGLIDKRERHQTDDKADELERLRRENKRLKREFEENAMVVQLLKKVKEFERM